MSGFLHDTNIPSETIRPHPDADVMQWRSSQSDKDLFLSVISIGELREGIALLTQGRKRNETELWFRNDLIRHFENRLLPVTHPIAERWKILTAERRLRGVPLHPADGQIAATALEHTLHLVTRNVKDFVHLGDSLFNPWE
ncbi:hypothetical protein/tRNA(fMet)-specific endonuclease VapC [Granulicella pectinivorans]|uniref:PIN domain-containing protein n=1 Tax=Granulicella pectinivorans TaxID=474950 RepID=A0A1I6LM43_9BACT|nr:type II toxin-antitoxin system VapC family toxin [Granulicella pectinivorans]SFS04505.1 hypothetical protein/tRNA(fMet)-specific endonuclease VapC [Granulicella pectinivorans]